MDACAERCAKRCAKHRAVTFLSRRYEERDQDRYREFDNSADRRLYTENVASVGVANVVEKEIYSARVRAAERKIIAKRVDGVDEYAYLCRAERREGKACRENGDTNAHHIYPRSFIGKATKPARDQCTDE